MHFFFDQNHHNHMPPFEVFNGDHDTAQEVPERAEQIYTALCAHGHTHLEAIKSVPSNILTRVHDEKYLDFLQSSCTGLKSDGYLYPSVRPYASTYDPQRITNPVALRGQFVFDMYTPLLTDTWHAALSSASLAYLGAQELLDKKSEMVYALCRPPGHHAEHACAGGYCYINNAAVAAQTLSKHGKVAIIDVDFHHGNGTQHIFYDRSDVLTVSIHADPHDKFPFYSGFADETGMGVGSGFNHNIPLSLGTSDREYDMALSRALERVALFKSDFLIIAYGADTHESDPIGGFKLSTPYFQKMGSRLKSLNLPTLIVQEGGYNNEHLGTNVVTFLSGFEKI